MSLFELFHNGHFRQEDEYRQIVLLYIKFLYITRILRRSVKGREAYKSKFIQREGCDVGESIFLSRL